MEFVPGEFLTALGSHHSATELSGRGSWTAPVAAVAHDGGWRRYLMMLLQVLADVLASILSIFLAFRGINFKLALGSIRAIGMSFQCGSHRKTAYHSKFPRALARRGQKVSARGERGSRVVLLAPSHVYRPFRLSCALVSAAFLACARSKASYKRLRKTWIPSRR